MKKSTKWMIALGSVVLIATAGCFGVSMYYYNYAIASNKKTFINNDKNKLVKSDPLYKQRKWYINSPKQKWTMTGANSNLKLDAYYIPATSASHKTAILAHGFGGNKNDVGTWAYIFHQLGYNVLLPDNRGQGDSEGKSIGFGWPDRLDYKKWAQKVVAKNGEDSKIVMFGESMGAAGMAMVSGVSDLPKQVKAFVLDSPYTSAYDEIVYQNNTGYHVPNWPIVPMLSAITKVRAGYGLKEANALTQIKKNTRPILFITGSADTFVPTKMTHTLYHADPAKGKELLVIKDAKHVESYKKDQTKYAKTVTDFVNRYVD